MKKTISLYTHWGEWMTFSLTKHQLQKLRGILQVRGEKVISMAGYKFKVIGDYLYFSNAGVPSKYYFEMTLHDIILAINNA